MDIPRPSRRHLRAHAAAQFWRQHLVAFVTHAAEDGTKNGDTSIIIHYCQGCEVQDVLLVSRFSPLLPKPGTVGSCRVLLHTRADTTNGGEGNVWSTEYLSRPPPPAPAASSSSGGLKNSRTCRGHCLHLMFASPPLPRCSKYPWRLPEASSYYPLANWVFNVVVYRVQHPGHAVVDPRVRISTAERRKN